MNEVKTIDEIINRLFCSNSDNQHLVGNDFTANQLKQALAEWAQSKKQEFPDIPTKHLTDSLEWAKGYNAAISLFTQALLADLVASDKAEGEE